MNGLRNSIKGRLFIWIFSVTALFLVAAGFAIYQEAKAIVCGTIDMTLHSKAQVITGLLHAENGAIELELQEIVSGDYSIPRSGHYFKVIMDGTLLAASPSLVDSSFDLTGGAAGEHVSKTAETVFTSIGPGDEPVRVLKYDIRAYERTFGIFVAESLDDSLDMMRKFRRFLLIVIPSGILIVSFMALWIVRRSLEPIALFAGRIGAITHKTLDERLDSGTETAELAGLADSFNDLLDRLQKVFESEKRLIADASHELKTPVAVIKLHCDVLLLQERTPEEYVNALREIRSVTVGIDTLVKDLLLLSRLDSGVLSSSEFEAVSLNGCIRKSAAMVQPLAEQRSIRLNLAFGDDISINGNAENLVEVFLNILENGIKYNKDHGEVDVSTSLNGTDAVIVISDTGPGIAGRDQERIFDRFYRADSSRNTDGTGLGLSIARTIIDAHGGSITLFSEPGRGSSFTITLRSL